MKTKITYLLGFLTFCSYAQNSMERSMITKQYKRKELERLRFSFEEREKQDLKSIQFFSKNKKVVIREDDSLTGTRELYRLYNGKPIFRETNNEAAAISTRTRFLNSGGGLGLDLEGQNMNVAVWDAGYAQLTHQEYDGKGGQDRVKSMDISNENMYGTPVKSSHSAHVIGTIAASGVNPLAKGMAPQIRINSYIWNNDLSEATSEATKGLLISNHSYGDSAFDSAGNYIVDDYYAGAYIDLSRDWDRLMYNAPHYLMIAATGNNGTKNTSNRPLLSGYDKILGYKTCKNALLVANGQDAQIDANGNLISVEIHPSSSQGPTDDLRIKPDITGNGTQVLSTNHDGDSNYSTKTGSSMATPNVAGTAILLQQHFNNLNKRYMKASTLKGLILHSADDAGMPGPDAIYGWGLMNAKKAAEIISNQNNGTRVQELVLNQGKTYEFEVLSDGVNPLIASISWTDPAYTNLSTIVNNSTATLVNDLDIRISKDGVNYFPWRLTSAITNELGDNTKDPYEKVVVNGASGVYKIRISHKKSFLTGSLQNYSLILTGVSDKPLCSTVKPVGTVLNNLTTTSASLKWDANLQTSKYEVSYKPTTSSNWIVVKTDINSIILPDLIENTDYELRLRNTCDFTQFSEYSPIFTFKTLVSDQIKPSIPTDIIFNNITTNSLEMSWALSTDNVGVKHYVVYQDNKQIATTISNKIVVSNLSAASLYGFNVVAVDVNGNNSDISLKYSVSTLAVSVIDDQKPSAPTNISVSNITTNSANLKWDASIDNVGVKEYEIYLNDAKVATVASTSFALNNLLHSNAYKVAIRAIDTNNNSSDLSASISFSSQAMVVTEPILVYCTSKATYSNNEWIDYVELNQVKNLSVSGTGYTDNTKVNMNLPYGTNAIVLSAGLKSLSSYSKLNFNVWIDYNRNGVFETTEKVLTTGTYSSSNISSTFSVPSTATSGATRMRIQLKTTTPATTACDQFLYGEVEDYTVTIGGTSPVVQSEESLMSTVVAGFYPNPVEELLYFNGQVDHYMIYDATGTLIDSGKFVEVVDLSYLKSGVYVIMYGNSQTVTQSKFVKK